MAEYVNFKLRTGEDLVGVKIAESVDDIVVNHPIQILVHPTHGYFAKSWMMLSDEDEVMVKKSDLLWCTAANDRAVEYYDDFLNELLQRREPQTVEELQDDLEELYASMTDAKVATKH